MNDVLAPLQFPELIFGIAGAILSRRRVVLYAALGVNCALWFTYLADTALSVGNHHPSPPAPGAPATALPSYAADCPS